MSHPTGCIHVISHIMVTLMDEGGLSELGYTIAKLC